MAHVTVAQVQQWLNSSKYPLNLASLPTEQEHGAAEGVFAALEQRYDTSTWVDEATTPSLVRHIIAMLCASSLLRIAISEDDGIAKYCDWLDKRAQTLVDGLVSGALVLVDAPTDPEAPAAASISFWPTQAATDIWEDDPYADGGAARAFDMQKVF